ncbi:MAG: hypothetical protein V4844_18680, partial [Pseudomonadota bacterium]
RCATVGCCSPRRAVLFGFSPSRTVAGHSSMFQITLAVVIAFCAIPMANAIGDSGGCGDPSGGPLGKALKSGRSEDVEREVLNWISYKEKNLGVATKFTHLLAGGDKARQQWRQQQALDLLEGTHDKNAVCVPVPLLPVAVRAGNLGVVRFLLGTPMGMSLKMPPGILFSCDYDMLLTDEQRTRRRVAFSLVLDTKLVDVNALQRGRTILQECTEPELVTLFVERGANINVESNANDVPQNLLEIAILDAVGSEEGGYTAKRLHGVERARIYSRLIADSINGRPVERRIRWSCNLRIGEKRWNAETCRQLSTFIKASPGTFGEN